MNLHVLQRASTHVGLAGLTGVAGVAGASGFGPEVLASVPPEVYVVGWMGVVSLVVIRWMARVGQRTPRTPTSELARLRSDFAEVKEAVGRLDARVDGISERTARIEGNLGSLVVVRDGRHG